jgi:hypothetical protein
MIDDLHFTHLKQTSNSVTHIEIIRSTDIIDPQFTNDDVIDQCGHFSPREMIARVFEYQMRIT